MDFLLCPPLDQGDWEGAARSGHADAGRWDQELMAQKQKSRSAKAERLFAEPEQPES